MYQLVDAGRALPYFASIPFTVLILAVLINVLRSVKGTATRFVIFAVWLRFVLSAFHPITFAPSPLGVSWNALASVAVCGVGLLNLRPRAEYRAILVPIGLLIPTMIVSGIANGAVSGSIDMIVKFVYLAVIALATHDALCENGWEKTLRYLSVALWVPLGFQILSVLLGVVKPGEDDGAASYIGGYNHEASFSIALATGVLILALRSRQNLLPKAALLFVFLVGLFLANYRTAIVAMLPLFGVAAIGTVWRTVLPRQRFLVVGLAAVLLGVAGTAIAVSNQDRFADIATVATEGSSIIKPPRTFTIEDRHLMSGRALIWSNYLYGYAEGTPLQQLIGLGPNSWSGVFRVYAHNTLVSAIYELGIFGFLATIFMWLWMLAMAVMADREHKMTLVAAHLCFIILCQATMPLWLIEGMIFYGLLCGCTARAFFMRRGRAGGGARNAAPQPRRFELAV